MNKIPVVDGLLRLNILQYDMYITDGGFIGVVAK